jgi:predicted RNA-binding Zn-ribbon protein involved in translation (DUF1610 family)
MNQTSIVTTTYSVKAACENCGHTGKISAKKGTRIVEKYECPNCGCNTYGPSWGYKVGVQ